MPWRGLPIVGATSKLTQPAEWERLWPGLWDNSSEGVTAGTVPDTTPAQVLKMRQGFLTEEGGKEDIIGRWKSKSKGLDMGKPWVLLDRMKRHVMAGELEARWGGVGMRMKEWAGQEPGGP